MPTNRYSKESCLNMIHSFFGSQALWWHRRLFGLGTDGPTTHEGRPLTQTVMDEPFRSENRLAERWRKKWTKGDEEREARRGKRMNREDCHGRSCKKGICEFIAGYLFDLLCPIILPKIIQNASKRWIKPFLVFY